MHPDFANVENARSKMIEQQIRPWNVLDPNVLNLLAELRREQFVPRSHRHLAFVDMELPLPHGQVMLAPKVEARLLQELSLLPGDRVLEIGAGSGYMAALMARQAAEVLTVEKYESLAVMARDSLASAGISNAEVLQANGLAEDSRWSRSMFDAIALSGAVEKIPEHLLRQLNPGGRMVAIVGTTPVMQAVLVERIKSAGSSTTDSLRQSVLFETVTKPLEDAPKISHFKF
ncbi:MAG: protein-L-isoaspartate O-methyltransferase [Betaproteobacteria bacterium]|jgi:protein-L-isoaspartate(D-aspartate) O-methyltransferase|nr:protein-L-isoaspartate O-methyltransferase [Betaproteobacteria bacterium]